MKVIYKVLVFTVLVFAPVVVQAQVIISLVFGEALNSDKIEFGLKGGMNRSYISSISNSEGLNNFDLGFYFHIHMMNNSYLSTGVHVKSNVGATGMATYSLGDPDLDAVFSQGTLTRKIPVFYVPILWHQRFNNRWYIEAGPQLGLIHQSVNIFEAEQPDGDVSYTTKVQDEIKRIDMGLTGGIGYKFKQEIKSTAVGVNYYYGLVDVSKTPDVEIRNSSIYFYVKVPIGSGKEGKSTDKL